MARSRLIGLGGTPSGSVSGMLVPSDSCPDGLSLLEAVVCPGAGIRAAVAFVTRSGVVELGRILSGSDAVTLEVTARAGDVTEPEALLELRDGLGADVLVVIGKHAPAFHPKLWLVERQDQLVVVSGSGNLTASGLRTNDEQFELLSLPRDSDAAIAQVDRFERLTRNAVPLDRVEGSAIWREWQSVRRRQIDLRRQLARAERHLNGHEPIPDRSDDKARLIDDLQQLYDATVAADLPRADGERYYPARLLGEIKRARDRERDRSSSWPTPSAGGRTD